MIATLDPPRIRPPVCDKQTKREEARDWIQQNCFNPEPGRLVGWTKGINHAMQSDIGLCISREEFKEAAQIEGYHIKEKTRDPGVDTDMRCLKPW